MLLARAAIREELTCYLDAVMRHDWGAWPKPSPHRPRSTTARPG